jgi:hypothetical protein
MVPISLGLSPVVSQIVQENEDILKIPGTKGITAFRLHLAQLIVSGEPWACQEDPGIFRFGDAFERLWVEIRARSDKTCGRVSSTGGG